MRSCRQEKVLGQVCVKHIPVYDIRADGQVPAEANLEPGHTLFMFAVLVSREAIVYAVIAFTDWQSFGTFFIGDNKLR